MAGDFDHILRCVGARRLEEAHYNSIDIRQLGQGRAPTAPLVRYRKSEHAFRNSASVYAREAHETKAGPPRRGGNRNNGVSQKQDVGGWLLAAISSAAPAGRPEWTTTEAA